MTMISGYEVGTEVKWNSSNSLATGTVEKVFREPEDIEIAGQKLHVGVSENSPTYLIRHQNGEYTILPHRDVFLKHMNDHT